MMTIKRPQASPRRMAFYHCNGDGTDPTSPRDELWACMGCFSCMPPTRSEILTRMDKEYGCLARLTAGYDENGFVDYCGDPEADPYSNLCTVHAGHGYWRDLDRVRYDIPRTHPI